MLRIAPFLLLAACRSTSVPPPDDAEAAVLAADIRVTGSRADAGTTYPRRVLFVRLAEGDEFAIEEPVWSNYARGTRAYCFNARPGRYAIAAAVPYVDGKEHFVFLPGDVVRASVRDVPAGGVVSFGTTSVNESLAWGDADEIQKRFRNRVVAARPPQPAWRSVFPAVLDFRGESGRHRRDDGAIEAQVRKQIRSWGWER